MDQNQIFLILILISLIILFSLLLLFLKNFLNKIFAINLLLSLYIILIKNFIYLISKSDIYSPFLKYIGIKNLNKISDFSLNIFISLIYLILFMILLKYSNIHIKIEVNSKIKNIIIGIFIFFINIFLFLGILGLIFVIPTIPGQFFKNLSYSLYIFHGFLIIYSLFLLITLGKKQEEQNFNEENSTT